MPLTHPNASRVTRRNLSSDSVFIGEGSNPIPRDELPRDGVDPDLAYQIIHDELLLDGNARLNLATFVTTWMEPQAQRLYAETYDKNMIDKDEYPQTAELEMRCANMLARLFHAPEVTQATGCSTTGSSEAGMLGGWRSSDGGSASGRPMGNRPTGPI